MQVYNNELYHYGVLGMKWGHRKGSSIISNTTHDERNEMRKERHQVYNKEFKKEYKKSGLDKQEKSAFAFAKKYGLDLDDGGGGSLRAGSKYNDMLRDIDNKYDKIDNVANKKASEELLKKYGDKKVKSLQRHDTAKVVAGMSGMLALPVGAIMLSVKS